LNFGGSPYFLRVKILEVIQRSSDFLAKKAVESPRLQVELILSHVLAMPRMQIYLSFERELTVAQLDDIRSKVQRRGNREPLQYILGTTSFCGIELSVNSHVLIPRPETELLAERGWKYLSQLSAEAPLALDFGAGSGCIAIALAKNTPKAQVHALDISADALGVAQANAARNKIAVQFHQGDGFAALPVGLRFYLIVSNPPYISSAEIVSLEPEVRDHEPRGALDGGPDGLDFYRRLALQSRDFLEPSGTIMIELGDGQAAAVSEIFKQQNWIVEAVEPDYTQRLRVFVAHI
jgi:release factor glutamine methyltransferase